MTVQTRPSTIVTGASRGLGLAVALRLARDGHHLTLAAREVDTLAAAVEQVRAEVNHPAQKISGVATDVSNPADVDALVKAACSSTGTIDALVCNAGVYGPKGYVENVDWSEWARAIEINLYGTVLCCRAVLPGMRRHSRGKIVVLSGGGATQPLPRLSAYAAAKAAVVRFAETLAEEVSDAGIDVNAVAPGALNTRLLDEILEAGPERVGPDFYARAVRQHEEGGAPLERGADLISFLVSSASDGVTGRLLSAVWDDWEALPDRREELKRSDVFTLRRIVPADRGWSK
jgi:NAD(P)-dependent dehydrogenase (short-subunit alcohol dehydrogenase family)